MTPYRYGQQLKANKVHELKERGIDLLANAQARLRRCEADGDALGAEYNKRRIAEYKALLAVPVRDVPDPPTIPGARR